MLFFQKKKKSPQTIHIQVPKLSSMPVKKMISVLMAIFRKSISQRSQANPKYMNFRDATCNSSEGTSRQIVWFEKSKHSNPPSERLWSFGCFHKLMVHDFWAKLFYFLTDKFCSLIFPLSFSRSSSVLPTDNRVHFGRIKSVINQHNSNSSVIFTHVVPFIAVS